MLYASWCPNASRTTTELRLALVDIMFDQVVNTTGRESIHIVFQINIPTIFVAPMGLVPQAVKTSTKCATRSTYPAPTVVSALSLNNCYKL